MPIPLSPLEQRALWLAYHRSVYGPLEGILENEFQLKEHYTNLVNGGLLMRATRAPRLRASRGGQTRMFVITHRGKLAKTKLDDLGYKYPYITDLTQLPTKLLKVWSKKERREIDMPCVLMNDVMEYVNYQRLSRGYPTLSNGWLRRMINRPPSPYHKTLTGVKYRKWWYVPLWEVEKNKRWLIKPVIYYGKTSKKKEIA